MAEKIAQIMDKYGILIGSFSIPEIAAMLEQFGYSKVVIDDIIQQYQKTKQSVRDQAKEHKDMFVATQNFIELRDEIDNQYRIDAKVCSLAFADHPDLIKIVPGYVRITPYSTWERVLGNMYNSILKVDGALAKLERFRYTDITINSRLDKLNTLVILRSNRAKEKGEAEESTIIRNEMIDDLTVRCNEIIEIAKKVFGRKSQILEKMGIITKN